MDTTAWGSIALALVNAGLAEQKNRSRWTWFVLSLFIGPLATAIIVIWPRAEPAETRSQWTPGMLLACSIALAVVAIAAGVAAIVWADWALWVACAIAALGTAAFAYTAARARARADAVPPVAVPRPVTEVSPLASDREND